MFETIEILKGLSVFIRIYFMINRFVFYLIDSMSNLLRTLWFGSRHSLRNVTQRRNISRTIPRNEKPSVSVASESTPSSDPRSTMGEFFIINVFVSFNLYHMLRVSILHF